jgi:hypothetical protein
LSEYSARTAEQLLKQGQPEEALKTLFQVVRDNRAEAIVIIPRLLLQNLTFPSWDGKLTKFVAHLATLSNGRLATLLIQKAWIQGRLGVVACLGHLPAVSLRFLYNALVLDFRLGGIGLDWVAFNASTLAVSYWT